MAEILFIKQTMLKTYLTEQAALSFAPGVSDCAMFCLDWLGKITGDTSFKQAYVYRTERDGRAFGALRDLADNAAAHYGLSATSTPQAGDVALLNAGTFGHVCAIRTASNRWAFRAKHGIELHRATADIIRCWRV